MADNKTLLNAFYTQLNDLVKEMISIIPGDANLRVAKNSIKLVENNTPELLIKLWKHYVGKYKEQIDNGDFDYFLNKDYSEDIANTEGSDAIIVAINNIRNPIKEMSEHNKAMSLKYIQNITKLSFMYKA